MKKYYVHYNGSAWFVKGGDFFESQGGLTAPWGQNWKPLLANSVEDARAKAGSLTGQTRQPRMNELDALRKVYKAGVVLRKTSPLDNDFPLMLHLFNRALMNAAPLVGSTSDDTHPPSFDDLFLEICHAQNKFPGNVNKIYALYEEAGELTQAMLEQKQEPEKGVTDEDVYKEAIQTACVALRIAMEGDSDFPYNPLNVGLKTNEVK